MKALFNHELFVVRETAGDYIELESVDDDRTFLVPLSDDRLIIDPTDGDLDEAEALSRPGHCCTCPHVTYLIVNIRESRHECAVCGETFTDAHRTKIYVNRG